MNTCLLFLLCSICFGIISCGGNLPLKIESYQSLIKQDPFLLPHDQSVVAGQPDFKIFEINAKGTSLKASIDSTGLISILNYPDEWHGRAALIHFDGVKSKEPPFSESYCQSIREMALSGFSELLVRTAYNSVLSFDIPPFLSANFADEVYKSARAAGFDSLPITIENYIAPWKSSINLNFSKKAITLTLGNLDVINEQIHLGHKGSETKSLKKELIAISGDIICDLISGDAKLTMIYPIISQDRVIKIIYDSLEVHL